MQSASLEMVQTCLLSSRPLSISTCFLATIITLHFAHICIYFSACLNSSPSSCLQQGHIHVSHGSDLITFRPSVFVCVSFPMEISVLIPYGKTLICESLAFFSFTMHHLTFFFKFSNTNPFFESSSCLKMCWEPYLEMFHVCSTRQLRRPARWLFRVAIAKLTATFLACFFPK